MQRSCQAKLDAEAENEAKPAADADVVPEDGPALEAVTVSEEPSVDYEKIAGRVVSLRRLSIAHCANDTSHKR